MSKQNSSADQLFIRRAIELAARSPQADPNPRVGCVLVRDGKVLGEGWHKGAGTDHAEVAALKDAGDASGATAYVSLEPCNHTGRTGPCAQALIKAGVKRVRFAQPDPNPDATGGAETLQGAGVDVQGGLLAEEATRLNRYWTFSYLEGRPFVTWKVAATLDGRTAATDGTSQWITGESARADVHERRASAGAIAVGTGTVLADNPRLTTRHPDGSLAKRQPIRVVFGAREIPKNFNVYSDEAPTLFATQGIRAGLAKLSARGVHHLWLEGGANLAASFVREGLVDEVVCYLSGSLLGAGKPLIGDLGISTMADIKRLHITHVEQLDDDCLIILKPTDRKPCSQES